MEEIQKAALLIIAGSIPIMLFVYMLLDALAHWYNDNPNKNIDALITWEPAAVATLCGALYVIVLLERLIGG